jgi:hypothetical protein
MAGAARDRRPKQKPYMCNHKQTRSITAAPVFVLCTFLMASLANSAIPYVDQVNVSGGLITGGQLLPGQSLGQSFTPNAAGIDLFDVQALSSGFTITQLELFNGETVTGTPIATSGAVVINYGSLQTTEYQFSSTVPLVPGNLYTARIDLLSGPAFQLAFSSANPYQRGLAIDEHGFTVPNVDWVFSEGLLSVPEPSTGMLFGLFASCLALKAARPRRPAR